jgi:DNA-binding MarR family transcriptional regulator
VEKLGKNKGVKRDLAEEIDLLDTMLSSLVEILEEKGVVTQEEWEKRIKERVTIE